MRNHVSHRFKVLGKIMKIEDKVKHFIEEHKLIDKGMVVVLGVSGGADSVCMYKILKKLSKSMDFNLEVVHINHGIRGEEADRDMNFVEKMCAKDKVAFSKYLYDVPGYARKQGFTEEEAGRILRYKTFREVVNGYQKKGIKGVIAVAHNEGDSAETFIYNLCRGTGLDGVTGIAPKNDDVIRPVLCLSRDEIESYLKENSIEYVEDSTNKSLEYSRNKIRHKVIPYLQNNINEKSVEHITYLSRDLGEVKEYLEEITYEKYKEYSRESDDGRVILNKQKLSLEKDYIQARIIRLAIKNVVHKLKDITRNHVEDVMDLLESQTGRYIELPYNIRVKVVYDELEFSVNNGDSKADEREINYEITKERMSMEEFSLKISGNPIDFLKSNQKIYTKYFNCDKINDSLSCRKWNALDRIVIDDKGNKKDIKSYLKNIKVPADKRKDVYVLAMDHEVLWVIGYRISEKYKVTKDTKEILKVSCICNKDSINSD